MQKKTANIVMLLSMGKLDGNSARLQMRQQSPQDCKEMLANVQAALPDTRLNVSFLYADGLYRNSETSSGAEHRKRETQMLRHKGKLEKEIPSARFITSGQSLLEAQGLNYESVITKMRKFYMKDEAFKMAVDSDTLAAKKGQGITPEDVEFILQELVLLETVRRQETTSDKTIIVYPGKPLNSDLYLQNKKHPMGTPTPVTHSAQWMDVADSANVTVTDFAMPRAEKRSTILPYPLHNMAVAAAAVIVAGVALTHTFQGKAADDNAFTALPDGSITLIEDGKTVVFTDAAHPYKQVVIQDGKVNPIDTREEGYMAYHRGLLLDRHLKS
jgi:hypothetical protein